MDSLLAKGAVVRVADDFSSGRLSNLEYPLKRRDSQNTWFSEGLSVWQGDLKDMCFAAKMMDGVEYVFHLAALHGGRGYIDSHPADCCTNMSLDQIVFEEAKKAGVDGICFASSACVYPSYLQSKNNPEYLLKEDDASPFVRDKAFADLEYGWAKLMGEMALYAYHKEYGMNCSICRIFTAYGERENETHAVIALISKAFIGMDPYEIWGSGEQDRNFTYVGDIVNGLILAAENIKDATPVNLGTSEHIKIKTVAEMIFEYMKFKPTSIFFDRSKPEGVFSRAADLSRAKNLLGWSPKVSFEEGLKRTIDWYITDRSKEEVASRLNLLLLER